MRDCTCEIRDKVEYWGTAYYHDGLTYFELCKRCRKPHGTFYRYADEGVTWIYNSDDYEPVSDSLKKAVKRCIEVWKAK